MVASNRTPRVSDACDGCRDQHHGCGDGETDQRFFVVRLTPAVRPCNRCIKEREECTTSKQKRRKYAVDARTANLLIQNRATPLKPAFLSFRMMWKQHAQAPKPKVENETVWWSPPHQPDSDETTQTEDISVYPPSAWTLDVNMRETIYRHLTQRGFHEVEELIPDFTSDRESASRQLRKSLSSQQCLQMNRTFQQQIDETIDETDFEVPTLIWTRGFDIYYMNDSLRPAHGYTSDFDSPRLQIYSMLSNESIKDLCGKIKLTYLTTSDEPLTVNLIFRDGSEMKGELTVKRDLYGLPQLFCLRLEL
ncbi:hypothetical protein PROFUN_11750 [Planoprotostelium fungivorum]|uniref:Zn(2)-C6 fungal-type domain-containing protein n=1 Tax=Planoprotostelium fungivorum TaxID=1890364 RepID=A0A2P6MYF8_9EUKA|nr:hypothetical protein PROFUN_11750 [Planoprotostelium fungivorum]